MLSRTWLMALAAGVAAENATFIPTLNMTDTSGQLIQAHGGAILQSANSSNGDWFWFGEDKTNETNSGHFIGVNCYSSDGFVSWTHIGHVLSPIEGTNISSNSIVERPKVIYNEKNDEYVMWFHSDTLDYGAAMVGVATSKTIDGQYTWRGSFKPFGNDSRDMTVWKDTDDNKAYLVFATTDNADLEIASLDDDYYNVDEALYTFDNVYWEAPGVFKINGTFFLLYSRQDGWTPTDNYYMTATSMSGPWSDPVLLAPAGSYAYLTQNAYDIVIAGSEATFYMYYGDHWSGNALGSSTYSFYPVIYNGTALSLHQTGAWTLDAAAGTWTDLPYTTVTAAESSTEQSQLISCDDGCAGGLTANMTGGSGFTTTWNGTSGCMILGIEYTYDGPKNSFLQISVSVNGQPAKGDALLETTRGTTFAQESPFPVDLSTGDNITLTLVDPDGNDFFVDGIKFYSVAC